MSSRKVERIALTVCSEEYGVATVVQTGVSRRAVRKQPCKQCPWRKDVPTGVFPAEAFRTSATTAYDAAQSSFGCHMSKDDKPAVCAGFFLRHGENNLDIRLGMALGRMEGVGVVDGGAPLYESYREMAVANGVDVDDPALRHVRASGD